MSPAWMQNVTFSQFSNLYRLCEIILFINISYDYATRILIALDNFFIPRR